MAYSASFEFGVANLGVQEYTKSMHTLFLASMVFGFGYLLNAIYITVFYHRGLTHRSVILKPWVITWVGWTGSWVTGIDPKAWSCMHRLHHLHADTVEDPHSPLHQGVFGLMMGQLHSYNQTLVRLIKGEKEVTALVSDIPFSVNILNRKRLWILPYLLQIGISVGVAFIFGNSLIGAAYFLGIMSHPIQGWLVNSLSHKYGYTNFKVEDNSKNNIWVALAVFGEGFQNNHHARPASAKFSVRPWEIDFGYSLCKVGKALGLLRFELPPQRVMH